MTIDKSLYNKIISENINVHKKEAELYDIIHTFGSNWYVQRVLRDDLKRVAIIAPGRNACDLGCGTGNVTQRLLDIDFTVTAVDLSEQMLDQLRKRITADNVKIFCKNIDEFLNDTSEQYDIITINAVLHHMPDYLGTISKAFDHLSPDGVIYIVDGIHREKQNSVLEFVRRCLLFIDVKLYTLFHGNREVIYNHGIDYSYSDYHCNAAGTKGLDVFKIKNLIKEKGLTLVKFSGYNLGMRVGALAMLDNMLPVSKNCFRLIARKNSID